MRGKGRKKESAVKRLVFFLFDGERPHFLVSRSLSLARSISLSQMKRKTQKVLGGTTVVEAATPLSSPLTTLHRGQWPGKEEKVTRRIIKKKIKFSLISFEVGVVC